MKYIWTFCLLFILPTNLFSQLYTNLKLKEGELLVVDKDSLFIDTLVMESNAKLSFKRDAFVVVKNAIIGKDVIFDLTGSTGVNGKSGNNLKFSGKDGGPGESGKSLEIIINFVSLQKLIVDLQGGKGGRGGYGYSPKQAALSGQNGKDGGDGGLGGKGGDSGNLSLSYSSNDFVIGINQKRAEHAVILLQDGGRCGNNGKGGYGARGGSGKRFTGESNATISMSPSGQRGRNGKSPTTCVTGKDGKLILKRF